MMSNCSWNSSNKERIIVVVIGIATVIVVIINIAVITEIERITINLRTSSAAILMCMAWWSSRMIAITGVCPFDPSVPGVRVRKGEEGERVRMGWD